MRISSYTNVKNKINNTIYILNSNDKFKNNYYLWIIIFFVLENLKQKPIFYLPIRKQYTVFYDITIIVFNINTFFFLLVSGAGGGIMVPVPTSQLIPINILGPRRMKEKNCRSYPNCILY